MTYDFSCDPLHKPTAPPFEYLNKNPKVSKWCIYKTANRQSSLVKPWEIRDSKYLMWLDRQNCLPYLGLKKTSPLTWDILSRCLASSLSLAFWKWACSFSSPGVSKYLSTASGVLAAVVGTEVKYGAGERKREGQEKQNFYFSMGKI